MVCEAGASQAQHSGTCCFPSIKTPLNVEGSFSERTLLPHFLQCSVPSNFLNSPPHLSPHGSSGLDHWASAPTWPNETPSLHPRGNRNCRITTPSECGYLLSCVLLWREDIGISASEGFGKYDDGLL